MTRSVRVAAVPVTRSSAALLRFLIRAIDWAPLAVAGVLAVLLTWLAGTGELFTLLRMLGVLLGAAAGFAVADEMGPTIGATPVPRWLRQWLRAGLGGLTAMALWSTACLIAASRMPTLRVPGMAVEAATCIAVGLLAAAIAGRFHHGRVSGMAGLGGLLAIVSITLALRGPYWPWLYPQEANWEIVHVGWTVALAAALTALGWANRDLRT
ncbi:MAG: hypothetical protein HOV86_14145 [Thermoactinospora sp.]|nr:hypothetical protein [Thermoactinospora sp.]